VRPKKVGLSVAKRRHQPQPPRAKKAAAAVAARPDPKARGAGRKLDIALAAYEAENGEITEDELAEVDKLWPAD
jgi:hypothetical protein